MRLSTRPNPVELIPAEAQTLWGKLAVVNFVLGGAGAGFYVAAVVSGRAVALASWLGPALVLAGFAAVALEAGRPFRGARVLGRIGTSWMSRELWFGGAFAVLAASEHLVAVPGQRELAVLAALALSLAQGFILRRARGIAAWDVAAMPAVFVMSAVLSGAGLLVLVEAATGRPPSAAFLASLLFLLPLGMFMWLAFITWSSDEPFASSTRILRTGPVAVTIVAAGYVIPFALIVVGVAVPEAAARTATLAALSMLGGQIHAKAVLILTAGRLRPITLPHLTLVPRNVTGGNADRSHAASVSGHPRIDPAPQHSIQRRLS